MNRAPGDDGLLDGGPPLKLQGWLGLVRPGERNVGRRAVLAALVGWLPLLVLAFVNDALGSFISDFAVHARSLVAVPLFIVAEAVCAPRLGAVAQHFVDGGLVTGQERGRFDAAVASTRRLRDSAVAEAAVFILAYGIVVPLIWWWPSSALTEWHRSGAGELAGRSAAGLWHGLVSTPILLVLFLGWMWRLFLWTRFLWLISHLDLHLVPSHPDKAAGLKFLGYSVRAWSLLSLAFGTIVAGTVANAVVSGAAVLDYRHTMAWTAGFAVVLFSAPLLVFSGRLLREWRRGVFEYGALADGFGRQFERRWLRRADPPDETILEKQDFSAATDLYQVVDRVHEMHVIPADLKSTLLLAAAALLPFAPVVLMALPFDVIFTGIAGILF